MTAVRRARGWRVGPTLVRYVARELCGPTLIAFAGLTALLVCKDVLGFADLVINRGFGPATVAAMAGYETIALAASTLPFAVLIGTLAGVGRLRADGETVAIAAAGVADRQLVVPLFVPAGVAALAGFVLSLWAAPWAARALDQRLRDMAAANPGLALRAGTVHEFGGIKLLAREVSPSGDELRGVLLWIPERGQVLFAKRATIVGADTGSAEVVLHDGVLQASPRANGEQTSFDTFAQRLDDSLQALRARENELDQVATGELAARLAAAADDAEARKIGVALHRRVAYPLASFGFALLALPLALGGRRASRASGAVTGLVAALCYYGLVQLGDGLVAAGAASAAAGAWLPNLVVVGLAATLLVRRAHPALWSRRRPRRAAAVAVPTARRRRTRPPRFVLTRWVARQFAGMFLVAFALLLIGYLLVDVLERLQWFARFDAAPAQVVRFYALRVPLIASRVLSPALLLATALTVSVMASQNELVALRACGISMTRVVVPILAIGALAAPCLLALDELVLPATNTALDRYKTIDIKRRDGTPAPLETMIWLGAAGRRLVQAMRLAPDLDEAHELSIFELGTDGLPLTRVDARAARHVGDGVWELTDALGTEVAGGGLREVPVADHTALGDTPHGRVDVTHLGLTELARLIRDDVRLGLDTRALRTDWHARLAAPLACILLPAIALALADSGPPFPRPGVMLLVSTVLALAHLVAVSIATALGYGGFLPPSVAGWAPMAMLAVLAATPRLRVAAGRARARGARRRPAAV